MDLLAFDDLADINDTDAAARVVALRATYQRALATPLMSEGSISGHQVALMGKRARAQWQADAAVRPVIEREIRELKKPQAQRLAERAERVAAESLQRALSALNQTVNLLPLWFLTGLGAKNKVRPTYQRTIDAALAEARVTLATYPALATAEIVDKLDAAKLLAAALAEKAKLEASKAARAQAAATG